MEIEKIEKIIANKLNEYRFELPKDEYDLVAEELAETIVKNCSIPDVVKSLPTDRAINQAAFESQYGYSSTNYNSFKEGVKWVIEQFTK
jgi:hypothetical protein